VAHRQHDNFGCADDLVQRHIPGASERDDQFPLGWVLARLAGAEGRDRQPVLRRRLMASIAAWARSRSSVVWARSSKNSKRRSRSASAVGES
jgi:hypothetical protein